MKALFVSIRDCFAVLFRLIGAIFAMIEKAAEVFNRTASLMNETNKEWAEKTIERAEAERLQADQDMQLKIEQANAKIEQAKARDLARLHVVALSPAFYNTDDWRDLRYRTLRRYGAMCMCCGNKAGDGYAMHVDHIRPRSKYPELALDDDNVQILCEICNRGKAANDETDYREIHIDC